MWVTLLDMASVRTTSQYVLVVSLTLSIGFLPLAKLPILSWLGGSQFRKFCVICMIILSATVWITCWTQQEPIREKRGVEKRYDRPARDRQSLLIIVFYRTSMADIVKNIWHAILHLPRPVRRVCYVQLFAFMGW